MVWYFALRVATACQQQAKASFSDAKPPSPATSFSCACVRCTEDCFDDPLAPYFCSKAKCSLTFELPAPNAEKQRRCALCGLKQLPRSHDDEEHLGDAEDA